MSRPIPEPNWIQVVPTKRSDRAAFVGAALLGSGAVLRSKIFGQREGQRDEAMTMSRAQANELIIQLGGTPPST